MKLLQDLDSVSSKSLSVTTISDFKAILKGWEFFLNILLLNVVLPSGNSF